MGRVEKRLYKRRCKRVRALRLALTGIVVVAVMLVIARRLPKNFVSEPIGGAEHTPKSSAFDQRVETREITLAEETWYAIQTGVFSTREASEEKANAYTSRGAPGTIVQDGNKWRVFIACYESETDASAVRTRLASNQKVDTYLYAWKCPEVQLRLTGKVSQMDAVEAGFTLLSSSAAALRDAAISLDAAQCTTAEAEAEVTALTDAVKLWEDTVHQRFGRSIPDLVKGMMTMTANWQARQASIGKATSATELSATLKAEAMSMYDELIRWRNALLAQ